MILLKKIYSILKKDIKEISSINEKLEIEIVNINLNINVNDKFTLNMSFLSNEFCFSKNVPLEKLWNVTDKGTIRLTTSTNRFDGCGLESKIKKII